MTTDQIVTGYNADWAFYSFLVMLSFGWRLIRRLRQGRVDDTFRIMFGVFCVASGSFVHRTYWGIWRFYRSQGEMEIAEWFVDHADELAFLSVAAICLGYSYHLYPHLQTLFGRFWLVASIAMGVGLFFFFGYLPGWL